MVRPRRLRRIFFQPDVTYFKPTGIPVAHLEEVNLSYDELEAIRLIDSEGLEQTKAAKKMKISQSTLSRLLKEGRKKVADAIVQGQAIKIHGGDFKMAARRGFGRMHYCVCPSCGYKEEHQRGVPCYQKRCPKCNKNLIRARN